MGSSPCEHTVIFQIIKILLKVKLLGLSVQARICNPTLGKFAEGAWGEANTEMWFQKNKKGT